MNRDIRDDIGKHGHRQGGQSQQSPKPGNGDRQGDPADQNAAVEKSQPNPELKFQITQEAEPRRNTCSVSPGSQGNVGGCSGT